MDAEGNTAGSVDSINTADTAAKRSKVEEEQLEATLSKDEGEEKVKVPEPESKDEGEEKVKVPETESKDEREEQVEVPEPESKDEREEQVEVPEPESKDEREEQVEVPEPESKDEREEQVEVPEPESKDEGEEHVEVPEPESKDEGEEKVKVPETEKPPQRGSRLAMPSLLKELGMKVTAKGVLLPESRKTLLRRRRETRQAALANEVPPSAAVGNGQSALAKRKRSGEATPVLLDEVESDLFYGAHQGSVSVCAAAVAKGVDVNVRTKADLDGVGIGASALHVAAVRGHEDVAAALLHVKADAMAMTGRGETPVQLATRMGQVEVVKVLRNAGAAPQHAEGVLQLMSSAPSNWRDGQRKKLRRALAGEVLERPRSRPEALPQLPPPPLPEDGRWAQNDGPTPPSKGKGKGKSKGKRKRKGKEGNAER